MAAVKKRIVPIIASLAVVFSLVAGFAFAGSATADSGTDEQSSLQQDASIAAKKTPADESPYKSVASIGDSISAGYGPLMGNNTWSNYYYDIPPVGSYPYELTEDLGLDVNEDFNSMLCVDQRLIDVYYAMGGDPDPVVDPDSVDRVDIDSDQEWDVRAFLEALADTSYETVDYLEDARLYHSDAYMEVLEELHESGEGAQRIKDSDLITVMIGMADLAVYPIKRTAENGEYDTGKALAMMKYGFASYQKYLPKLIELIKELNPDATICVLGLYNPYTKYEFEGEDDQRYYEAMDLGIKLLNAQLKIKCALYGCTYVDVSDTGDYLDNESTTVEAGDFVTSLIDHENHPGAAGHKYIEDQILDALNLQRASKTPSVDSGVSYLAFTSDIHNADSGSSANRLDGWLDNVSDGLGDITFDYLSVCGDIGSAFLSSAAYASKVQVVMDAVEENSSVEAGIYTTGNHEYSPGTYATNSAYEPYSSYTRLGEAAATDTYRIYCFGAAQYNQTFQQTDIDALAAYLEQVGTDEPVFVLSHFPIHTQDSRSTGNAGKVIEVLNNYPNVIFIWGHNHTLSDTHYDTVYSGSLDGTPINFVYCAAGCMSDSDYSTGSGNTLGKGLVAAVDGDDDLTLTYYDKEYQVVSSFSVDTTIGSAFELDVSGEELDPNFDDAVYSSTSTLAEGDYAFVVGKKAMSSTPHSGYTCTNSTSTYSYSGFQGGEVSVYSGAINAGLTEDEVWTVSKTSGGYTIRNKSTGKYLTGYYYTNAGAKIDLEESPGSNGVWTYADSHLKNVATGKYLNFDVDDDVSGTLDSGEADLFTLRSSANDAISLYTSTGSGGELVTSNYAAASGFTDGSWYLLAAEDNAVTGTSHDGYVTVNYGSTYEYTGLAGKSIDVSGSYVVSKVSADMLWQAEKVDDGFALKNTDGKYLNASYSTTVSGYAGVGKLYVGDEPQAWVLSGTTLMSVSSGKYLNYQNDSDVDGTKQSGSLQFFTVRSSSNDAVTVYLSANGTAVDVDENEVLDTDSQIAKTEVVPYFDLVTGDLEDGAQVVFASKGTYMTDTANEGYISSSNSKYYRYSGLSAGDLGATAGEDISNIDVDATVWTVEKVDAGYYFKNSEGKYLSSSYDTSKTQKCEYDYYSGVGAVTLLETPDDSSLWIFSVANGVVTLTSQDKKVLTYNTGDNVSGTCLDPEDKSTVSVFTVRSSASNSLYLYQKVEKSYKLATEAFADGATVVLAYGGSYMASNRNDGYTIKNSSGEYYRYRGLSAENLGATAGTSLASLPAATNDMLWTVEKTDGGYMFKNRNGRYLSASYAAGQIDIEEEGEYLSVSAEGVGKLTILAQPDASCVWKVSFSSGKATLYNVACGKYLTYNSGSDVSGTCVEPADKSGVSLFTVRSSQTHSLYIYEEKEKIVTGIESGGAYLMVDPENYAVSSNAGKGYNDDTSNYRYDGLAPVALELKDGKIESTITSDMVWKLEKSGNGYTIQDAEGNYLNSVYKAVAGGSVGEGIDVFLSDTPEIWDIRNGYVVSESTGKYLTRQTNSGETNVFTLRSNKASSHTFAFYGLTQASTCTALYASTVGGSVSETREVLDRSAFEQGEASFAGATATPRDEYVFLGWYSGDTLLTQDATYVPTASGVYEARFEEKTATVRYEVKLKDGEGDAGDISLSSDEESYHIVSGSITGSVAKDASGYTFLYWTSDEEGKNIVAKASTYVPARAASDAVYYAWYRMDAVCFETVTEELEGVVAGTHHLVIDGTDFGAFVFTEVEDGWSIYGVDQKKFLSINDDDEAYFSSVYATWSYSRYGFSVSEWDRFLIFPVKKTYYLGSSGGELTLSVLPRSSTKLLDVSKIGYTSHVFDTVVGIDDDTHTLACSRCGLTVEAQEHEFATCVDKGDGTHTCVCEACGYEKVCAHTVVVDPAVEPTTEASGLTEGSHCSECGAVITAQEEIAPVVHTHAYGEWTVTKAATLGAEGQRCRTCGCGAVETEAIPALTSLSLTRLNGDGRYDTMAAISAAGFEHSDVVVVASGANYPDALSATGLAGLYDAPVLLSSDDSLSEQAADEITRLCATRAIIVGGTAALSESVESELQGLLGAGNVVRVYGSNRVATSIEVYEYGCIAEEGKASWGADAIVASSLGYADALSASPYSYAKHAPILLADGSGGLTDDASEALSGFSRVLLAGGELVVSSSVEDELGAAAVRLAGANRYATSAVVASFCISEGMGANGFAIATGSNYPDALAGGALCGHAGSVILLVSRASCSSALDVLKEQRSAINSGYVLGGSLAVSDYLKTAVENGLAEG